MPCILRSTALCSRRFRHSCSRNKLNLQKAALREAEIMESLTLSPALSDYLPFNVSIILQLLFGSENSTPAALTRPRAHRFQETSRCVKNRNPLLITVCPLKDIYSPVSRLQKTRAAAQPHNGCVHLSAESWGSHTPQKRGTCCQEAPN